METEKRFDPENDIVFKSWLEVQSEKGKRRQHWIKNPGYSFSFEVESGF